MRKIKFVILSILMLLLLAACQFTPINQVSHEKVFQELPIEFQGKDDNSSAVTNDLTLPIISAYPNVDVSWKSNHEAIKVEIDKGIVTRQETDTPVKVTIVVTISGVTREKDYDVVVLGLTTILNHTVTFESNLGSKVNPVVVETNTLVAKPKDPTRDEYRFMGWFKDAMLLIPFDFESDLVTSNLTLYAKWEEIHYYTVSFYVDATLYATVKVEENGLVSVPNPPSKQNQIFIGWFLGSLAFDFNTPITSNTVISAQFRDMDVTTEYDVTFLSDNQVYFSESREEGSKVVFPNPPTKTNYTFLGWLYQGVIVKDNQLLVTSDITLEASWKQNEVIHEEKVIETFETWKTDSSSYHDNSFVGVNGIEWSYTQSRGDQKMDGTAFTFGNKTTMSILKATIPGGISKLTFEAKYAFSGAAERQIDVYINDQLIESVLVNSDETKVYTVADIHVQGTFELKLTSPNAQRISIDNLTWYQNNLTDNQKKLNEAVAALDIPLIYMESGTLILVDQGLHNSHVSYQLKNLEDDSLVDLLNKTVTIPLSGIKEVVLIATITLNDDSKEKVFALKIGEGDPLSIAVVKSSMDQTKVKTQGVISGVYLENGIYYAYVQDNTAAIKLQLGNQATVEVHDEVIIKGLYHANIIVVSDINRIGVQTIAYEDIIYRDDLLDNPYYRVNVTGYYLKTINATTILVTLLDDQIEILTNFNHSLDNPSIGDYISFEGYYQVLNGKPIIHVINQASFIVSDISYQALSEVIMQSIGLNGDSYEIFDAMTLPTKDSLFQSTIVWQSTNQAILTNDGRYTQPEKDTTFNLNYTITLEGIEIASAAIIIIATAKPDMLSYYQGRGIENANGETLEGLLKSRLYDGVKIRSYGSALNTPLQNADKHPTQAGKVWTIYDGAALSGGWNKEHVIPKSWYIKSGYASHEGDVHNLRVSIVKTNSDRGNSKFIDGSGIDWKKGFFPGDEHVGDVARIAMYMMVMMPDILDFNDIISSSNAKNILLRWHHQDPVDDFERHRNQVLFEFQGNRNPFIDYPEFATQIWGTVNMSLDSSYDVVEVIIIDMSIDYVELSKRTYTI